MECPHQASVVLAASRLPGRPGLQVQRRSAGKRAPGVAASPLPSNSTVVHWHTFKLMPASLMATTVAHLFSQHRVPLLVQLRWCKCTQAGMRSCQWETFLETVTVRVKLFPPSQHMLCTRILMFSMLLLSADA